MGIPGMPRGVPAPAQLPAACRSDLLTVDGSPVPITITGSTASAAVPRCARGQGVWERGQRDHPRRPGPTRCRPNRASLPAPTSTSTVWSSTPLRAGRHWRRHSRARAADPVRSGPGSHRGALLGHLGPGRRARSEGPVLDGARREHQRGMARHHGLRDGPGATAADRRIRQRLARHTVATRCRHGDQPAVDTAETGMDRTGGVGRGDPVVHRTGRHAGAPAPRPEPRPRGGAGRTDRHLPGPPTRRGGGGRSRRCGIEHARQPRCVRRVRRHRSRCDLPVAFVGGATGLDDHRAGAPSRWGRSLPPSSRPPPGSPWRWPHCWRWWRAMEGSSSSSVRSVFWWRWTAWSPAGRARSVTWRNSAGPTTSRPPALGMVRRRGARCRRSGAGGARPSYQTPVPRRTSPRGRETVGACAGADAANICAPSNRIDHATVARLWLTPRICPRPRLSSLLSTTSRNTA